MANNIFNLEENLIFLNNDIIPFYSEDIYILNNSRIYKTKGIPINNSFFKKINKQNGKLYDNIQIKNLFTNEILIEKPFDDIKFLQKNEFAVFYDFGIIIFSDELELNTKLFIQYYYLKDNSQEEINNYIIFNLQKIIKQINILKETGGSSEQILYSNSTPTPQTIGGISQGTTFQNKTMKEMWDLLLYPELFPVLTPPSFNFTLNPILVEAKTTTYLNYILTFSRGSINPPYGTSGFRTGEVYKYEIYYPSENNNYIDIINTNNLTINKNSDNSIYFSTRTVKNVTAKVYYLQGEQPLTSKGNNYDIPYPAGNIEIVKQFRVVFPCYATTENINLLTKQPLSSDLLKYFQVSMVAETDTQKQKFACHNSYIIEGIQFYNTISGQWEWLNGSKQNSLNSWTQTNINDPEDYILYINNSPKVGARLLRFYFL